LDQTWFASAFRRHALLFDPEWPHARTVPADAAMDDALNAGFSDAVAALHDQGRLLQVDEDDCDFGNVAEDWQSAATEAMRLVQRQPLVKLLAPSRGGIRLAERTYRDVDVAELAEDVAAWTKSWALPRGHLNSESAARALLLWVSPAACDEVDAAVRVLAADPFVARATRYAALRLSAASSDAGA
jgi:hypothetical protein